jgi:hypothetical protein
MREKTKQVAFRLSVSLLKRLDRYAERLRLEAPWSNANRADAVRALLTRALDEAEGRVATRLSRHSGRR